MNLLHIFSNWKWTGPAEHALNAAVHFMQKGHRVVFACARPPHPVEDSLIKRAEQAGLAIQKGLYLNKHFTIWRNVRDIYRLRSCLQQGGFQLIHTHLPNDHLLTAGARLLGACRVPIIRTVYDGPELRPTLRNRLLLQYCTDSLITVSAAERQAIGTVFRIPAGRIWNICPGVDCDKFNPGIDGSGVRKQYGISADDPVVGIVARVQKHRRFEVLIGALSQVIEQIPRLKVLLIGRGTHMEEIAVKPVHELGLENNIIMTGYHLADYPELLAALDVKIFLVPGSDGSCRAVREAMAMGKPVIAANRGMLPELVRDGVSGFVVEDTPENLARAIIILVNDLPLRRKMGEAARQRICSEFSIKGQMEKVESVYRQTLQSV
jgi:glycosyltransferase involved in cell wall biosynthesis